MGISSTSEQEPIINAISTFAYQEHEGETPALPSGQAVTEDLVVDDLLVEDVSIDGMCGVY